MLDDYWAVEPLTKNEKRSLAFKEQSRGYTVRHGEDQGVCRRCGVDVNYNNWQKHDQFHFRVDMENESENSFGVFSEQYKRKYPDYRLIVL